MNDYKIFLTQKDETWQQAIDRLQRFRDVDMREYFSNKDYSYHFGDNKSYTYQLLAKISINYIEAYKELYRINIPSDLVDLYCKHGPFCIGQSLLEIYNNTDEGLIFTLSEILRIYNYESIIDKVGKGMFDSINNYYFFFGICFPESAEIGFLYFNKAGYFGKMIFAPNNEDLVLKKILPSMFNGSISKYNLNELISEQIDRIIINALTVKGYIL